MKSVLPTLGILSALVAYIAVVVLLLWAPGVLKRWVIILSRILGIAAGVLLVFVLTTVLFGFLLASGNPPTRTRIVRSSDGQEATLSYDGGFLGRDYTKVTLKRNNCCRHTVIFWHAGPSWFDDPKVEWLDNRHLRLTYHARPEDPQHCEQHLGDVAVTCVSMPWPDSPTAKQ